MVAPNQGPCLVRNSGAGGSRGRQTRLFSSGKLQLAGGVVNALRVLAPSLARGQQTQHCYGGSGRGPSNGLWEATQRNTEPLLPGVLSQGLGPRSAGLNWELRLVKSRGGGLTGRREWVFPVVTVACWRRTLGPSVSAPDQGQQQQDLYCGCGRGTISCLREPFSRETQNRSSGCAQPGVGRLICSPEVGGPPAEERQGVGAHREEILSSSLYWAGVCWRCQPGDQALCSSPA